VIKSLSEGGQAHAFIVEREPSDGEHVLKRLKNLNRVGRFRAEVTAGLQLSHPNVLRVVDATGLEDTEKPWMVTEFCLKGALSRAGVVQLPLEQKLTLFAGICEGVAHAHGKNIIHRDLKPDNIFLRDDGTPVVGDFGLCFFTEDGERLTLTEEAVGSRYFTAPELEDGRAGEITPRADVYSMGKILYWLMTGKVFSREKQRSKEFFFADRLNGSRDYLIYEFLDRTIVAEPGGRLASGIELVAEIKVLQRRLAMQAHVIDKNAPQPCSYCGLGSYVFRVDQTRPQDTYAAVKNFGFMSAGLAKWRILECDQCGHVQLFRLENLRGALMWGR